MKKLVELNAGAHFNYGGAEWVKLATWDGAVIALAAEIVFNRAFDEENCNDWRKSSLRRELNGPFLDALVREGADRAAFLEFASDLTADDGMTDYGEATDQIALLSCDMYREFRGLFPLIDEWWWTLTPWTCNPEYSCSVRNVISAGALNWNNAYNGDRGVRPLCNLKSDILVSIPGEEDKPADADEERAEAIETARDDIFDMLGAYPVGIWGDALGAAVAGLFQMKQDAADAAEEEKLRRAGA